MRREVQSAGGFSDLGLPEPDAVGADGYHAERPRSGSGGARASTSASTTYGGRPRPITGMGISRLVVGKILNHVEAGCDGGVRSALLRPGEARGAGCVCRKTA